MNHLLLLAVSLIMMISCNNNNNTNPSGTTDLSEQNTIASADTLNTADSIDVVPSERAALNDTVSAKRLPVEIRKTISNDSQSVRILLTDAQPGMVKIHLSHSNENGNIHISRVIMPDGSSDGAFGRSMTFDIKQKGNHTIVIGSNNRASGSQIGDIVVKIEN